MDEQYIAQLVYNLQCGDQQAFEDLYNQTNKMVYFICKNLLNNEEDAKDVMQDVYITAYYKIDQLAEQSKFQAWINQIAVNKCKNYLAKNKPVLMAPEEFNDTMLEENELFLPEEYIIEKEKRKIIMNIMRKSLSDIQYNTVILYYFNGLSVYEIADIMECPPGTVTYRLSVARAKIKEGVLLYENKTEDKLYSVAAIPFLVSLFAAEASGLIVPNILPQIMTALTGTVGTVIGGMANTTFVDNVAADMSQTMMQSGQEMMSQLGQGMYQSGPDMMNQVGYGYYEMPAGQGMMQPPGQEMMNQAGYGSYEMPIEQGQGMMQSGYEAYGMTSAGGAPVTTGAATNVVTNASAIAKAGAMALKTKIAIGIASAALLCGGIALVLNINKDDKDKKKDNKTEITTEQSVVNTTEEAESNTTEATTEEYTEEQLTASSDDGKKAFEIKARWITSHDFSQGQLSNPKVDFEACYHDYAEDQDYIVDLPLGLDNFESEFYLRIEVDGEILEINKAEIMALDYKIKAKKSESYGYYHVSSVDAKNNDNIAGKITVYNNSEEDMTIGQCMENDWISYRVWNGYYGQFGFNYDEKKAIENPNGEDMTDNEKTYDFMSYVVENILGSPTGIFLENGKYGYVDEEELAAAFLENAAIAPEDHEDSFYDSYIAVWEYENMTFTMPLVDGYDKHGDGSFHRCLSVSNDSESGAFYTKAQWEFMKGKLQFDEDTNILNYIYK